MHVVSICNLQPASRTLLFYPMHRVPLIWLATVTLAIACASPSIAATYYVRVTGNDGNSGLSPAQAWQTIDQAANTMVAGDTAYVGARTYDELITPNNDGTAANPIRFVADTDGSMTGAAGRVLLSSATRTTLIYVNSDNYIEFHEFTIDGSTRRADRWCQ